MILLFLGSWRSTLAVAVSIPLSISTSIILLGALGQTINIMTSEDWLSPCGILVDDATVTIENINRNLALGNKTLTRAILDGGGSIATPALVATLASLHRVRPVVSFTGTACPNPCLYRWRWPSSSPCWPPLPALANAGADHGALSSGRADRGGTPRADREIRNPLVRMQGQIRTRVRPLPRPDHRRTGRASITGRLQLAAMGAEVTAVEIDPARAARLRENLAPHGLSAEVIESDARDFDGTAPWCCWMRPAPPPALSAGIPTCPGSRAPPMSWPRRRLPMIYWKARRTMVEPDGLLVFAVCSLEREEGEEQIAAFLSGHREFRHVPVAPERFSVTGDGSRRRAICAPCLVTWPGRTWMAFMPRDSGGYKPPERVSDRQINLARIGGENGRGEKPAAIAFARRASRDSNSFI